MGTEVVKLSLFVDGVILFMSNPSGDLAGVFEEISSFGQFSGYKINITKSKAHPIGPSMVGVTSLGKRVSVKMATNHIPRHKNWKIPRHAILTKLLTSD